MNREIEEMVKVMCCDRKNFKSCKSCKSANPNTKAYCRIEHYAELLYKNGYRKSTDVASSEGILGNYADFLFDGHRNIIVLTEKEFAELRKKHESEGADDV